MDLNELEMKLGWMATYRQVSLRSYSKEIKEECKVRMRHLGCWLADHGVTDLYFIKDKPYVLKANFRVKGVKFTLEVKI